MACDWFEREGLLRLERAESLGEHPAGCAECRGAALAHQTVRTALAEVGAESGPRASWQGEVWRAIAARSGRRRLAWLRWLALPAAAAVAAALVVMLPRAWHASPGGPVLLLGDEPSGRARMRGDSYHAGDRLVVRASSLGSASAELRVYREDTQLVLACGDVPGCERDGAALRAEVALPSAGRYQVVLLVSSRPLPAPRGSLDADTAAAVRAGATLELREVEAW